MAASAVPYAAFPMELRPRNYTHREIISPTIHGGRLRFYLLLVLCRRSSYATSCFDHVMPTAIGDVLGYNGREREGIAAESPPPKQILPLINNYAGGVAGFILYQSQRS